MLILNDLNWESVREHWRSFPSRLDRMITRSFLELGLNSIPFL